MKQRSGNCINEAFKLKRKIGGEVYYVARLSSGGMLGHAYLIPPNSSERDSVQNGPDNGYPTFPLLSVREVLESGQHLRRPSDANRLVFT